MTDRPPFFGLVHIDREAKKHANLDRTGADATAIYIGCAALAARSARACGVRFGLFTNEPALVAAKLADFGVSGVPILTLDFPLAVPDTKNFYSAHFKIDVVTALGTGRYGPVAGLVDVDTVFCRPVPAELLALPEPGLAVYDVSRPENPLHSGRRMRRDLAIVAGRRFRNPRWYGGEFLFGHAEGFARLSRAVAACWPRYVENVRRLSHVGDETTVSVALNEMAEAGFPIVDHALTPTVIRWWSTGTVHPQPAFDDLCGHFLLHLPADKEFLAEQASRAFSGAEFAAAYKRQLPTRARRKRVREGLGWWFPPKAESVQGGASGSVHASPRELLPRRVPR